VLVEKAALIPMDFLRNRNFSRESIAYGVLFYGILIVGLNRYFVQLFVRDWQRIKVRINHAMAAVARFYKLRRFN
jgi:hypothetical protein